MNTLTRWNRNTPTRRRWADPFSLLQREINDLFNTNVWDEETESKLPEGIVSPAIDVQDHDDYVNIRCDLPGVDKKDIDIAVSGNILTIKGEKKGKQEDQDGDYYRKEIWSGSFQRSVNLPDSVDADKADAEMKDGVLTLKLPKKEEKKRKQLEIKVK